MADQYLISRPEKYEDLKSNPSYTAEFSLGEELLALCASGIIGEFGAINRRIIWKFVEVEDGPVGQAKFYLYDVRLSAGTL